MTERRVHALWRYPVKSMLGERLERARVGDDGVDGDRVWAVRDAVSGNVLSAKRVPQLLAARAVRRPGAVAIRLPDGTCFYAGTEDADAALTTWLARAVRLATPTGGARPMIEGEDGLFGGRPGAFMDSSPIHLITTGTLQRLRALAPADFDARRFRPNVLIDTDDDEQTWVGRTLRIGDLRMAVTKPCRRCVMTSVEQDDLPHAPGVLSTVARDAQNTVGVYARVAAPGVATAGDEMSLD